MNIAEDYKQWYKTKESFLDKFKEVDSLIYIRLEPIIQVLNHLATVDMDDSEYYIFDIGTLYLHEQILALERYVELLSLEGLEDSSVLYNYLMDAIDFYEDANLEEENRVVLELKLEELEKIFLDKEYLPETLYQDIEWIKENALDEYASVIEIFNEIAFEYQLM